MNRRPIVAIACSFIVGSALQSLWHGNLIGLVLAGLVLILLGIGICGYAGWKLVFICILVLMIGSGERRWVEQRSTSEIERMKIEQGSTVILQGFVANIVEVDGDLASFRFKVIEIQQLGRGESQSLSETIIIRIKLTMQQEQQVAAAWLRGDQLQITGTIERPGAAGNFDAFDYRAYLRKEGVHWQLSAKGTVSVNRIDGAIPWMIKPLRMIDGWRTHISDLMDRLYSKEDSGYMKGLVAGIRADLDPQQYDAFARLGLTHILAISGLHVGVIVYLLLQLGTLLRLTKERTIDITIMMMPVYMVGTGASPSAVRACLMAMLALWLARRSALRDGLHLLAAAAIIMLVWDPRLVEDISFQLSFIVTTGLLLFAPLVTASLPIPRRTLKLSLSIAITAQLVSFPLTAFYFHSVHLLSLLANLVFVPFISFLILPLGMASVLLGAMWLPLGMILAKVTTWGNRVTFYLVDQMTEITSLRTIWPRSNWLWVIVGFMLMGCVAILLKIRLMRKKEQQWWMEQTGESSVSQNSILPYTIHKIRVIKGMSVGLVILISLWLLWGIRPVLLDATAKVMFLDVGQGDSILIRSGEGHHLLIDAGGTVNFRKQGEEWKERSDPYEVGRKLIVPLLLDRGVRELDAFIITHLDADHMGGAKAIIENIPVRTIFFNGTLKNSSAVIELFELARAKGIPCYAVHAGMDWTIDESMTLRALYPMQEDVVMIQPNGTLPLSNEQNKFSIVMLATIYGRTFLLSGDVEAQGESEVIAGSSQNIISFPIDVLKVGHHGSKTSTTEGWLVKWHPAEAVISVGRNNLYGHPHPTVMERLNDYGVAVYRTDLNGEVQYRITSDGSMERRTKRLVETLYLD
ncbi:MAG: DNA internalization-related competence protein ComEC/Rec2 [Candidatus Cohnella colombiensis]|uniref:DNA internalization-related competence protein ComEC/Rec2 n=1 Tax=Candidatus Cohnella colombiensis TaxID=3121368 RepID=A0AA95JAK7_9BACL|nr:MAG: DNA internalization-related competence protein ComEC/Rec2 [Cohnella sp.]